MGSLGAAFRRAVERMLPWYDPEDTKRRNRRTDQIRERAIGARIAAEQVEDYAHRLRDDYAAYAARLARTK